MINIADKPVRKGLNSSGKVFNSSPLDFKGVSITSLNQVSYRNFEINSSLSIDELLKQIKNSNPSIKIINSTIIGDSFYDNEESKLINKPDEDIWKLEDCGNGLYVVKFA